MQGTFTAIKEKNGERFKVTLPFNPLLEGWQYVGACCCKITFSKDNMVLKVEVGKSCMYVLDGSNVKDVITMPRNHSEFKTIATWL